MELTQESLKQYSSVEQDILNEFKTAAKKLSEAAIESILQYEAPQARLMMEVINASVEHIEDKGHIIENNKLNVVAYSDPSSPEVDTNIAMYGIVDGKKEPCDLACGTIMVNGELSVSIEPWVDLPSLEMAYQDVDRDLKLIEQELVDIEPIFEQFPGDILAYDEPEPKKEEKEPVKDEIEEYIASRIRNGMLPSKEEIQALKEYITSHEGKDYFVSLDNGKAVGFNADNWKKENIMDYVIKNQLYASSPAGYEDKIAFQIRSEMEPKLKEPAEKVDIEGLNGKINEIRDSANLSPIEEDKNRVTLRAVRQDLKEQIKNLDLEIDELSRQCHREIEIGRDLGFDQKSAENVKMMVDNLSALGKQRAEIQKNIPSIGSVIKDEIKHEFNKLQAVFSRHMENIKNTLTGVRDTVKEANEKAKIMGKVAYKSVGNECNKLYRVALRNNAISDRLSLKIIDKMMELDRALHEKIMAIGTAVKDGVQNVGRAALGQEQKISETPVYEPGRLYEILSRNRDELAKFYEFEKKILCESIEKDRAGLTDIKKELEEHGMERIKTFVEKQKSNLMDSEKDVRNMAGKSEFLKATSFDDLSKMVDEKKKEKQKEAQKTEKEKESPAKASPAKGRDESQERSL